MRATQKPTDALYFRKLTTLMVFWYRISTNTHSSSRREKNHTSPHARAQHPRNQHPQASEVQIGRARPALRRPQPQSHGARAGELGHPGGNQPRQPGAALRRMDPVGVIDFFAGGFRNGRQFGNCAGPSSVQQEEAPAKSSWI